MSLRVDDVDEVHKDCVAAGLDVTFPPTDMPWNVREMHVRHPDGHVFRGKAFEMNEAQVPRQIRKDIAMPHAIL
jgi:Glyoxalase/Bleomycin resistance protein/Dioxygenase superfamily